MHAGVVVASGVEFIGDCEGAVAPLAGTPLVRRVADRLEGVVDVLVVVCRDHRRDDVGVALARYGLTYFLAVDTDPGRPLSGVAAGLRTVERETDATHAFVVAGDMPFLEPALVEHLFERAAGHEAAVPRTADGPEPLQAAYRVDAAADACDRALAQDGDLCGVLSSLDAVTVDVEWLRERGWLGSLERVDSPEALADAEGRLSRD